MEDSTRQEAGAAASPSCPHADRCPGCPLIRVAYSNQCATKRARVVQAIAPYATLAAVEVAPTLPAEAIVDYRVRAKLIVGRGPSIGLYDSGRRHQIVDIPECLVLAPLLRRTADAMRALLREPSEHAGAALIPSTGHGVGALCALDLRLSTDASGTQSVLLTLVLDEARVPDEPRLVAAAAAIQAIAPWVAGVAVNQRSAHAPQVLGPSTRVIAGASLVRDHDPAGAYQLSGYGAFVQAHPEQARLLRRHLREALEAASCLQGRRVVDVYGGAGAIGIELAQAGAHVTMIESFAPAAQNALEAAREQAACSQTLRGTFQVRVGDAAHELRRVAAEGRPVDAVVVNPPRRGVDSIARRAIAGLAPKLLAYVSCHPDSLARDLDHFARLGYRAARVVPVDMMPLTEQVETLAILEPAPLPAPAILYQDEAFLIVAKGPDEPIAEATGYPVSFLQRLQRLTTAPRTNRHGAPTRPSATPTPIGAMATGASGALLLAFDPHCIRSRLRSGDLQVELTYVALVRGVPAARGEIVLRPPTSARPPKQGESHKPVAPERVPFERLERLGRHALLAVRTGIVATDALRSALARMAHPVVGDERWGHAPTNRHMAERHGLTRLFLHGSTVGIRGQHGPPVVAKAPLWADLEAVLASLRRPEPA